MANHADCGRATSTKPAKVFGGVLDERRPRASLRDIAAPTGLWRPSRIDEEFGPIPDLILQKAGHARGCRNDLRHRKNGRHPSLPDGLHTKYDFGIPYLSNGAPKDDLGLFDRTPNR